jgi:hypothetical protein
MKPFVLFGLFFAGLASIGFLSKEDEFGPASALLRAKVSTVAPPYFATTLDDVIVLNGYGTVTLPELSTAWSESTQTGKVFWVVNEKVDAPAIVRTWKNDFFFDESTEIKVPPGARVHIVAGKDYWVRLE